MWFKNKTVKLLIGEVSLHTLKSNPQVILNEYDRFIEQERDLKANLVNLALEGAVEGVASYYGYREPTISEYKYMTSGYNEVMRRANTSAMNKAEKFVKELRLKPIFRNAIKKLDKINELEKEKIKKKYLR